MGRRTSSKKRTRNAIIPNSQLRSFYDVPLKTRIIYNPSKESISQAHDYVLRDYQRKHDIREAIGIVRNPSRLINFPVHKALICAKRSMRKQVLFANGKAGGSVKRRNLRNINRNVRC